MKTSGGRARELSFRRRPRIHQDVAEAKEGFRVERLGKEVGDVVGGADERDVKLEGLDHVTDEEVAAGDVLRLVVVLGVVRQVAGRLVIAMEMRCSTRPR